MASSSGPSETVLAQTRALYALIEADAAFVRLRCLMEVDWTEADATVDEVGLPRLLQVQARKLASLAAADPATGWADVADAIRYTERHDETARTALWWLGFVARSATVSSE